MNLRPRSFRGEADLYKIKAFIQGIQPWEIMPDYWNTGKSMQGMYITFFDGALSDHQLWEDENGQIQAYTWLSPADRSWQTMLHPAQRQVDVATEMLLFAETQLKTSSTPQVADGPLKTVAYETDTWLTALIQTHGYVKANFLDVYMQRSLELAIPQPRVKTGFVIREFQAESELAQRAGAQHDSFGGGEEANAWAIENTKRFLRFYEGRDTIDLVAISDLGIIAAYAVCVIDSITKLGEFDPVGTRQAYRRQGLANALMLESLRYMQAKGMKIAVVRTTASNEPAIRLYESVGFTVVDKLHKYVKH